MVRKYDPVEASMKIEKLLEAMFSPQITRHAGFGNWSFL
jgi:hypothetical protein